MLNFVTAASEPQLGRQASLQRKLAYRFAGEATSREGRAKYGFETLDEIIPADRHIGVIQLDIEGYEADALKGARDTVRRCQPIIVLETIPGPIAGYAEGIRLNANHALMPVNPH